MTPDEMLRKLQEPFPREAIKQREGGRGKMLDYVEMHTVVRRLNAATGGTWDFAVLGEAREGDLLKATCRLSIPGLGSREHVGVQKVSDRGGEDLHKGAISDALKKCATLFGVGLELYGEDYEGSAAGRLDTAQVIAILGEMDDARTAWAEIKLYADDESTGRGGDDQLRIHDKLQAIAKRRRESVKLPASVAG
jgi:hypothetical protein